MAPLIDLVSEQLSGPRLSQISRQLGIPEQQTREALPAALAALTGAMAQNASHPQGAQQLSNALSRDHDGSILDSLDDFLGGGSNLGAGSNFGAGASILGHVLGGRQQKVETNLGRATGLNAATMSQLLMLLAPIVLGALGRRQRQQGLDPGGLSDLLGGESRRAAEANPQARRGLGALLDRDGDGQVIDDLIGGLLTSGRR